MRIVFLFAAALLAVPSPAAERRFNFSDYPLEKQPPGFRSIVAGRGSPGDWKVIMDDVPPVLAPLTAKAPTDTKRAVLAQSARLPLDHHYPILLFDEETYGDFKLTTRFKIVGGALEQMAGIVFRYQNESNFYVVRASVLGKNFRCYRVDDGVIRPPLGPEVEIAKGEWNELSVQCEGTRILCAFNGKEAIKLVDNSSSDYAGKIGFWTMSDSVSHFVDTKITYTPRQVLAQALVEDALKQYPRLLGLAIFSSSKSGETPVIVASREQTDVGRAGGASEADVIARGTSYFSKNKESVSVTMPLQDRNGEPIAAVKVTLKSFPGQTEENAVVRAQPIVKFMQARVQSLEQLRQ
jgi:hypothetical protein